jgi:hypothetical protein
MLEPWRDFFSVVGEASATLVGLMFVAASVGTGVFTEERQVGLRTLLSPTVVAFSAVLANSLVGLTPSSNREVPAVLVGGIGVLGLAYSAAVWRQMAKAGVLAKIDIYDRIWYAIAPACAYAVLTSAGAAFALDAGAAAVVLALGMGLLLLAGIRNAWDMTTWVVLRRQS